MERDQITDLAEQLLGLDENSRIPFEILEEREERCRDPLNLNRATREELEKTGLFTPFQVQMILDYRNDYGELYSIYELGSLSGFRVSKLKELTPYITVEDDPAVKPGRDPYDHPASTRILFFTGRVFPDAKGYLLKDSVSGDFSYRGSPLSNKLKIKIDPGSRIRLGLAYEKDPGEKGFRGYRPEYLAGYIAYSGRRNLDQIILGTYTLHLGLGLERGTGMFHSLDADHLVPHSLSVLKSYAGTGETVPHRGLACRMNTGIVQTTAWISLLPMDMSLEGVVHDMGQTDWVAYRRESGLHRTSGEINGRNLGYLADAGIQLQVHDRNIFAGGQVSTEISGLTEKGADSLGIATVPSVNNSVSIFWHWRRRKFESFGEYSVGRWNSSALQSGSRFHFSEFLNGCLLLYHYGASHRESFSSAYASGSHVSNERGLALFIHAEPCRKFMADLSVELYDHSSPGYRCIVPSSGARFSVTLHQSGTGHFLWKARLVHRIRQGTPDDDQPGIRSVASSNHTRVDGRFSYHPGSSFRWESRFIASFPGEDRIPGLAAVQQAGFSPLKCFRCTLQCVVFHVPQWEGRIYIYEPGLYHQFDFPVYYGQGQKIAAVLTLKPGSRTTLECKATMARYHDRDMLGSGNDLVEGSEKFGVDIQFRLKL